MKNRSLAASVVRRGEAFLGGSVGVESAVDGLIGKACSVLGWRIY